MSYEEAQREIGMVVEGYHALEAAMGLAEKYGVEMPITAGVYSIIMKGESPRDAMHRLMNRDIKSELDT
jgi:glycerol-3-phosphate dehydrogenase (NAD(P)+)